MPGISYVSRRKLERRATAVMGFDFMEDRPLHEQGAQGGDGGGGGGSSSVGVGEPHRGGKRPAPGRPSAHSEQRVASLFDLLQELSVPPKPGGSSHTARAAGAPRGTPASSLASSLSTGSSSSSLDVTDGNQQQPSAASKLGATSSSEEKRRRRDGAGLRDDAAVGGPLAARPRAVAGSRRPRQQRQGQWDSGMPVSNDSPPRPAPRPVLRREGQQERNPIGTSSTDEARRVTFAIDEDAGQARSLQSSRGSADSSSRDCDQRAVAAAITGTTIASSRPANARPGNDDGNSNNSGGGGGGRLTNVAATAAVSGATPDSNALGQGVALPAMAATQATLSVSPVNRPGARQREGELSTRRRRVDGAGGGGRGRENSGTGGRRASGESARGAAGRQRGPPLGVRENNAAASDAGPLWRVAFPARRGGGGEGGGEGPRGTTGERGRKSTTGGRRQGKGGTGGTTSEQVDDRVRSSSERWTALLQDGGDEVQWMTQGGDPTSPGVDGSRRWSSASTNLDTFRGGDRVGTRSNTRTTSQAEEGEQEEGDVGSGGGSGSGGGGQRGRIARRGARAPSPSAGEHVSPGRARGGKRARRTADGRDSGGHEVGAGSCDDGQGLFEGSSRDEGCTYFDNEDPAAGGGAQDDGRHEDNDPNGAPQKKELLRVRGLCRMQGSVLALVEWSIVDVDGATSTEMSFVLSSTLKAEWPRQYIDYLEAKMVFDEEEDDGA